MTIRQRVMRYLLGLFIGTAMVFFMFPNHDWFGWTPNKQLMQQIRESKMEINAHGECMMTCTHTTLEQVQAMRNHGKVDFSKSDAQATPRKYHVHYGESGMDLTVTDTLVILYNIEAPGSTCNCPNP